MITFPPGVRVWLATGHTHMRRGFRSLAPIAQEQLKQDQYSGHLFIFRGRRGGLIKRCARRLPVLEEARALAIYPATPADGAVTISPAQMGYLRERIWSGHCWLGPG